MPGVLAKMVFWLQLYLLHIRYILYSQNNPLGLFCFILIFILICVKLISKILEGGL